MLQLWQMPLCGHLHKQCCMCCKACPCTNTKKQYILITDGCTTHVLQCCYERCTQSHFCKNGLRDFEITTLRDMF